MKVGMKYWQSSIAVVMVVTTFIMETPLMVQVLSKKWTMPIRDWKLPLNRFAIEFRERFPR